MLSKSLFKTRKITKFTALPSRNFFLGYDNTNVDEEEETHRTRVYKKYAPSKPVLFQFDSEEGKLAKVFETKPSSNLMNKLWTLSIPGSIGIGTYLEQMYGYGSLYVYSPHLVLLPIIARWLNTTIMKIPNRRNIS